ncbi:pyridoxamine 5'-phosphate oxidase family protein [Paenibacillus sp. MCAF20]
MRSEIGYPGTLASNKVIHALDSNSIEFIKKSSFIVLATSNHEGLCDASPRGDAPGFVHVLMRNIYSSQNDREISGWIPYKIFYKIPTSGSFL